MLYYESRLKVSLNNNNNNFKLLPERQYSQKNDTILSWAQGFLLKMHLGKKIHNIIDHYYDGKVGKR